MNRSADSDGQPDAAPGPPLLDHVERLMAALHAQVPKALDGWDVEGIHQSRVATRRLKAALDLLEPALAKKRRRPLEKVLRRLRRRLGPLRDIDVMLEHLEELAASSPKLAPASQWLARHLAAEGDALRKKTARKGSSSDVLADLGAWYPVREQVAATGQAVPGLLAESLRRQLDSFVEQSDRLVAAAPAPGPSSAPAPAPAPADALQHQDPHELRIAGKALRYTLEMAAAQGYELPGSVLKTFKRMQETLGGWHDFVVLTDAALRASLDSLLGHHDPGMQEKVLDLARVTLKRSERELDAFKKLWSAKGKPLAAAIRDALPGSPAVSEPQTGPGPADSPAPQVPATVPPAEPSAAS